MFVLNCPSCGHQTRVKFARMGAVASCVGCKQKFKVDSHSLIVEEEPAGGAAPPVAPDPIPAQISPPEAVEEFQVDGAAAQLAPDPTAEALSRIHGDDPATPPPQPPVERRREHERRGGHHGREGHRDKTRDKARSRSRKKGVNPAVVMGSVVGALLLCGVIVWLVFGKPGATPNPAIGQTPQVDGDKPPVGKPPVRPKDPSTAEVAPVAPVKPTASKSGLPQLVLETSTLSQLKWAKLDPTVSPIAPHEPTEVVLWQTWLDRRSESDRAMIQGMFVADSAAVHKSGFLHIQLLDVDGRAFAEMKQAVPMPCSQQGLRIRVPIPAELMARYANHVAEFTPIDPVTNAATLEMVEARSERLNPGENPATLKLAVRNPGSVGISDPRLVVDVLDSTGWPIGSWAGHLDQKLGPEDVLVFEVTPPLPEGYAPSRVAVRGYGIAAP
jgi:hypothetical protein